MKQGYCKLIGCPRLVSAETGRGQKPFAQCNQHMPDSTIYFEDCSAVSRVRCKELRNALKKQREVQQ